MFYVQKSDRLEVSTCLSTQATCQISMQINVYVFNKGQHDGRLTQSGAAGKIAVYT